MLCAAIEMNSSNCRSRSRRRRTSASRFASALSMVPLRGGKRPVVGWYGKFERGAVAWLGFHPDSPSLAVDYLLTKRETDAGAWDFTAVQALEHAKHAVAVLWIDAHAVIPHGKQPAFGLSLRRDMDSRRRLAFILYRIRNEVLEGLHEQNLLGLHDRQGIGSDDGAALGDGGLEVPQRLRQNRTAIHGGETIVGALGNLPIGEQGFQERLNAERPL